MSHRPIRALADPILQHATEEVVNRLVARGVWLTGREDPEELVAVLDAVEQFELVTQRLGADLLIDEPLPGATAPLLPDDPAFVLPGRGAHESAAAYVARILSTARAVEHAVHRRRSDPPG
jgi:hypothetical protein